MTRTLSWTVKICGVTSIVDAEMVRRSGATAIGLNFYSRSLRSVSESLAAEIVTSLRSSEPQCQRVVAVGVFVNHLADEILRIADATGIDWIQLHGDEPFEVVSQLNSRPVLRVIRPDPQVGLETVLTEANHWIDAGVKAILLDAPFSPVPHPVSVDKNDSETLIGPGRKLYGGAGRAVDWEIARKLVQRLSVPIVLAGGLNPDNVEEAIRVVDPAAVDVASGVEAIPARKSSSLVDGFVSRANRAFSGI